MADRKPTKRQEEVADLLGVGNDTLQIAAKLGISLLTVKRHLSDLYACYGIKWGNKQVRLAVRLFQDQMLEEGYQFKVGEHSVRLKKKRSEQ
jgi:DNA-binding NarL/FixJ family response regulator